MIAGFFKNLLQVFAFACILAAAYLNIIIVPQNNIGLLVEKTDGLTKPLLQPGYHWNWTGFIPFRWSHYNVNLNPPVMDVHLRQPLRYGRYMEDPEIFSIDLHLKIKYKLSENSAIFFWNYYNNKLLDNPQYIHERVKLMLGLFLSDVYRNEADVANLGILFRKYVSNEGNFKRDWDAIFKEEEVQLLQYDITKLDIPEAAVYLENIKNIEKIFQARREATARKISADAEYYQKKLNDQSEIEKAEKFTELMKKYPDIIKYYQIEKINPKAKSVIILNDTANSSEIIRNETSSNPSPAEYTQKSAQTIPDNKPADHPNTIIPEERGTIEPIKK